MLQAGALFLHANEEKKHRRQEGKIYSFSTFSSKGWPLTWGGLLLHPPGFVRSIQSISPLGVNRSAHKNSFSTFSSKDKFNTFFNTSIIQNDEKNAKFLDLARIEADEAETWHTVRFHRPETENINERVNF